MNVLMKPGTRSNSRISLTTQKEGYDESDLQKRGLFMIARTLFLVALMFACLAIISPAIAQENPYQRIGDITEKDVAVNVESGIAKVSDTSNVTFSGAGYTHTLGRVSIRMKPLMDGIDEGTTSMRNTHISGVKSQVKYSVYRNLIKEEITLKSPETVRYSYDFWLSDWIIKIPNETKLQKIPGWNKTEIRSHFSEKEVINYARDSTIDIQPDNWGNLVVYVNGKDVVVMPRPFAIDATGKRFELGFDLDKKNKIISITGDLTGAQYPIVIDPTERVTNGNFETGDLSGWNYDPDDYEWFWESFVANEPYPDGPLYFIGVCGGPDGRKGIWQSVDLTNVDKLTFSTLLYLYTFEGDHPYFSVYIDSNEVLHVGEAWDEFNDYEINVSNYSGMHTVYFQVNGMETTAEFFINNISAIGSDAPTAPVADFTAAPRTGTVPLNVTFIDNSTGSPTSWNWSFGDGITSTEQNPSHIYTAAGMYTVSLTVANVGGNNTIMKTGYVNVTGEPVADFTATPLSGPANLTVRFNDTSTNNPTQWRWFFGDGTTSTSRNLSHKYTNPGLYTVNHSAKNSHGTGWINRTAYINVTVSLPVVNFTGDPRSGMIPLTVQFNDTSTKAPTSYYWLFGDGNSSTLKDPSFTYVKAGNYTVRHAATNPSGTRWKNISAYIRVTNPPYPVVNFTGTPISGCKPLTVQFNDISTNSPTSYYWLFGDGNSSTLKDPAFTYVKAGNYTVRHAAINSYGTRWKNVSAYIKVNNVVAPVADFTGTPLSGTAPMNVQFTDASTRSPTSWSWNFGDSGTATTQNPSHTYTSAGMYDVSLTAANMGGSNATVKAGYVSVTAAQVSNQATNIEGMTAKSTIIIGDAANKQTLINYDPATLFQPSQSTVKTRLPNDQIFFFDGHGNPGTIQINEVNGEEFLAQNDDNGYDFNSTSATYENLKLAVFSGCHTGETDSIAGNLVDVVSSKGAGCAIGYIGYILPDATYNWSSPFWDSIQQGKSIIQSQTDGLNSVIEDPLCQSMTPYNTWKYCGYDHIYIQGSGCQHPLPEVMTSLLTQNIKSSASDIQSKEKAAIIQIKPYQAQEQQVIREFSNEEITPKYEKSTKYSYGTLDIYTAENVTYKVNRNTGRIQSRFVNDIDSTSGGAIIDLNQGYSVAEAYAKEKSPEFWDDEKGKVIKTINQVAKDHELVYSWRQYFSLPNSSSNDSHEIAGYNIIDITLDARDSQVKFYHEWFIPKDTNLDLDPNISEEQAWELVKKHFENAGINITDKMQTHKFGLFIVIDDNNTQHLAWQFEIKQSAENPEYYGGQIIVDAHNGQIVQDIRYG